MTLPPTSKEAGQQLYRAWSEAIINHGGLRGSWTKTGELAMDWIQKAIDATIANQLPTPEHRPLLPTSCLPLIDDLIVVAYENGGYEVVVWSIKHHPFPKSVRGWYLVTHLAPSKTIRQQAEELGPSPSSDESLGKFLDWTEKAEKFRQAVLDSIAEPTG